MPHHERQSASKPEPGSASVSVTRSEPESAPAVPPINVAVGILMQPDGAVLMAQRPCGKPYAGYWEFPGGKVEAGEAIAAALVREFQEELGVEITQAREWCGVDYVYPHAHVRLHFFVCTEWVGEPQGLEGQALAWQGSTIAVQPILPATIPLLHWLGQMMHEP